MTLKFCNGVSPADWIVQAHIPWEQLVNFGPPDFPAYARKTPPVFWPQLLAMNPRARRQAEEGLVLLDDALNRLLAVIRR